MLIDGVTFTVKSKGYEQEFVYLDESGQIVVEEYQEGNVSTKAVCTHTYVSGTQIAHAKKTSGGCTMTYYTVVKCKKCGYVKSKKAYNQITSAVCTH